MSASTDTIRVLHVDDEPDFTAMAREIFERDTEGLTVDTATSASEALDRLQSSEYDCIVSDFDMPNMDGIELLEAVREDDPDLPFILYTGKGSEEVASEAISKGVTDYLQKKPGRSQFEILANRIENVVEQRRAQAEAVETEQRLRTIAENSNDILWQFTADWNELLFINSPYEEIWGRSIEELREEPRSFLEGIHPEDRPVVTDSMERLSAGESVDLEYRVNADEDFGRRVWVQGEPVYDDQGEVEKVVGFARDITERREQLDRYEALIEHSMDVITVLDEDGTITFESPAVERILGYDQDDLVGETAFEYVHPDDRDRVFTLFKDLVGSPDPGVAKVTYRFKHADGSWVWLETVARVEPDATVDGFILNSRDVTDRHERDRTLEQYETIIETLPVGVFVLDDEATIIQANTKAAEILGYDLETLLGTPFQRLIEDGVFDEAAVETYLDHVRTLLSDESNRDQTRFEPTVTVDGQERTIEVIIALRPFEDTFRGTIGIFRDITDQRRQTREIQRQHDRLDEYTSIVSHDLRNPLNVATGRLALAAEECDSDHLQEVQTAHERMEELIGDLLTLARHGETVADPDPLVLSSVVNTCWSTVDTADATIVADSERTILADESRLKHVFENLFRNAIDHGGDQVTIRVGEMDGGFFVEDDGPGIPADDRGRIFEAGYSTTDGGTGFGLSIVKEIVDAHGWTIRVTEGTDGGARFEITGVAYAD